MARTYFKTFLNRHNLKVVLPTIAVVIVLVSAYAHAAINSAPSPKNTKQPLKISSVSTKKSAQSTTAKVTPKTTAAPKTTPPKVNPDTAATQVATTPPVIVPAPTSSVSSLVPTSDPTPATTPSSSSSSSTSTTTKPAPVSYSSLNWAGYLSANGTYTSVSGSWTVPAATGNGVSTSADAAWIGIGGVTSGDLIQIGTDNIVSTSGQVTTTAFYEMLPDVSQTVPNMTVSPGDVMTASVTESSSNQWIMTITDITTAQTYSNTFSYTSTHSSAEWIEEDPSYGNGQQVPFDFFGSTPFTQSSMVVSGATLNLTGVNASPITMLNRSGRILAAPSAIGNDGASFSVTRH